MTRLQFLALLGIVPLLMASEPLEPTGWRFAGETEKGDLCLGEPRYEDERDEDDERILAGWGQKWIISKAGRKPASKGACSTRLETVEEFEAWLEDEKGRKVSFKDGWIGYRADETEQKVIESGRRIRLKYAGHTYTLANLVGARVNGATIEVKKTKRGKLGVRVLNAYGNSPCPEHGHETYTVIDPGRRSATTVVHAFGGDFYVSALHGLKGLTHVTGLSQSMGREEGVVDVAKLASSYGTLEELALSDINVENAADIRKFQKLRSFRFGGGELDDVSGIVASKSIDELHLEWVRGLDRAQFDELKKRYPKAKLPERELLPERTEQNTEEKK